MTKLFGLFLLALACWAPSVAQAASCFWVGGTGTWSTSNTTSWASGTGGTGGTCAATGGIPKQSADIATFDGSSGSGTVTVDSTINGITLNQIVAGAFTGTLDFSVNNPSITITSVMNLSGSGTRKFLMGTGTFTFTNTAANASFDMSVLTNLDGTSNFTGATYTIAGTTANNRAFNGGAGRSYGALVVSANASRGGVSLGFANTWASITVAAGTALVLPSTVTTTVGTAPTISGGSSAAPTMITASNTSGSIATLSIASGTMTCDACGIYGITATGGATFTATNSYDLGRNTGWTITPPSGGGGGGRIIGG